MLRKVQGIVNGVHDEAPGRRVLSFGKFEEIGQDGQGGGFLFGESWERGDGALEIVEQYLGRVRRGLCVIHGFLLCLH